MDGAVTGWHTPEEASVLSEAHRLSFPAHTNVFMNKAHQLSGTVLTVVMNGDLPAPQRTSKRTLCIKIVLFPKTRCEENPNCQSQMWQRTMLPVFTASSNQGTVIGRVVYLEQLWWSQVRAQTGIITHTNLNHKPTAPWWPFLVMNPTVLAPRLEPSRQRHWVSVKS